jgi:hypothetical protein
MLINKNEMRCMLLCNQYPSPFKLDQPVRCDARIIKPDAEAGVGVSDGEIDDRIS